jgi:hypothetical protein
VLVRTPDGGLRFGRKAGCEPCTGRPIRRRSLGVCKDAHSDPNSQEDNDGRHCERLHDITHVDSTMATASASCPSCTVFGMDETEGRESSEFFASPLAAADEPPRFSLKRVRVALAKHRAAEEAMADSAREDGEIQRVGDDWELPDGTWIHGRHPQR